MREPVKDIVTGTMPGIDVGMPTCIGGVVIEQPMPYATYVYNGFVAPENEEVVEQISVPDALKVSAIMDQKDVNILGCSRDYVETMDRVV